MIHINCYLFFFQEQSSLRKGLMKDCRVRCEIRFASSLCLFVIICFFNYFKTQKLEESWYWLVWPFSVSAKPIFFLAQGVCGVFAASLIGQILFLVVGPWKTSSNSLSDFFQPSERHLGLKTCSRKDDVNSSNIT